MRVLMFCPQFAPLIGGTERQAERLSTELCRQGADVRVLTPRLDASSPIQELLNGALPVRRFVLSDLSKRLPRLRGVGLINAPWIALQVFWQVWREARSADIVHCHIGSLQTVAAAYAARSRGLPVICKAAMADGCSDLGEAAKGGWTGRVVARLGRTAFTRWVATTQAVRDGLLRAGVSTDRIVVIPNGIALPDHHSPSRVRGRRFLYLGRLSTNARRDVPGLIHAFEVLADELADVVLAIVGDGDLLVETRALAAACRHSDRIRVPGQGNAEDWFGWADAFVLPSRREGLSNALLEAMAVGLPCIASDIPPNREVLENGNAGLLVPIGDTASWVKAMLQIAEDSTTCRRLSMAGRQRVSERYSMGEVVRQYKDLYAELHGRPSRATK